MGYLRKNWYPTPLYKWTTFSEILDPPLISLKSKVTSQNAPTVFNTVWLNILIEQNWSYLCRDWTARSSADRSPPPWYRRLPGWRWNNLSHCAWTGFCIPPLPPSHSRRRPLSLLLYRQQNISLAYKEGVEMGRQVRSPCHQCHYKCYWIRSSLLLSQSSTLLSYVHPLLSNLNLIIQESIQ